MSFNRPRRTIGEAEAYSCRAASSPVATDLLRELTRAPAAVVVGLLLGSAAALVADFATPPARADQRETPHVLEQGWRVIEEVRALVAEQTRAAEKAERAAAKARPAADLAIEPKLSAWAREVATANEPGATPELSPQRLPARRSAIERPDGPPVAPRAQATAPPAPGPQKRVPLAEEAPAPAPAPAAPERPTRIANQMRLTPSGTAPLNCVENAATIARHTMIWFEANSTQLNPVQTKHLQKLALALSQCPDGRVEAIGHADQNGTEKANIAVSRRRAEAALEELKASGLEAGRLSAIGRGASQPIAMPRNSPSPDPNAINRRVEFVVR